MEALITNQSELKNRGFRALAEALGWANAVRSCASMTLVLATTPRNVEPCCRTGMPRPLSRRPKSCRSRVNRVPNLHRQVDGYWKPPIQQRWGITAVSR